MAEIKFNDSVFAVNKLAPITYSFREWHDGIENTAVLEYHSVSDTVTMRVGTSREMIFDLTELAILRDFIKRLSE